MKKGFVTGTIVVALVALLAGVLTSGSPALNSPGSITITTRAVKLQFIDRGARGRGSGDVEVKRFLLYNKGIRERAIGYGDLVCTYTTRYARQCSGTYSMPKGRIVVGGAVTYSQFHELAVMGGTGLYDNVRGTLTVTLLRRYPERNIAVFRLVV
jgi:hypothetical protein